MERDLPPTCIPHNIVNIGACQDSCKKKKKKKNAYVTSLLKSVSRKQSHSKKIYIKPKKRKYRKKTSIKTKLNKERSSIKDGKRKRTRG